MLGLPEIEGEGGGTWLKQTTSTTCVRKKWVFLLHLLLVWYTFGGSEFVSYVLLVCPI